MTELLIGFGLAFLLLCAVLFARSPEVLALRLTLRAEHCRYTVDEWCSVPDDATATHTRRQPFEWRTRSYHYTRRAADRACARLSVVGPLRHWPQRFRVRHAPTDRALLYLLRANPRFAELEITLTEDRPHV